MCVWKCLGIQYCLWKIGCTKAVVKVLPFFTAVLLGHVYSTFRVFDFLPPGKPIGVVFPQSSVCLTGGSSFLDSAVRMSLNLSCRSVWFTPAPLLPQSRRNWKSVFRISNMSSSGQKSRGGKKEKK